MRRTARDPARKAPLAAALVALACGSSDGGGAASDSGMDATPADARPGAVDATPADCAAIPPGPFTGEPVFDIVPNEDLTFDDDGHLLWNDFFAGIQRTTTDGTTTILVATSSSTPACG